ncbi:MAG: SDR family NAD(P)-dependent oxidoreductase, partial [Chryseolinea sp.]
MTGLGKRFSNKHVLITGAARGLGFEIARHFALEGALLTLFDIHEENLNNAKEALEKIASVRVVKVDIGNKSQVVEAVEATDNFKPVDVL